MIKFSQPKPETDEQLRIAYYLKYKYYSLHDILFSQGRSKAAMGGIPLPQTGCLSPIQKGDHHYQANQVDLALTCYVSSLLSSPNSYKSIFKVGLCIQKGSHPLRRLK